MAGCKKLTSVLIEERNALSTDLFFIKESRVASEELVRIKTYLSAKEKINEKLFVAFFDDVFIGYVNQGK